MNKGEIKNLSEIKELKGQFKSQLFILQILITTIIAIIGHNINIILGIFGNILQLFTLFIYLYT